MSVAEELQSLQELHTNGKLTDSEFASAKASVLGEPKPKARPLVRPAFIVLALLFVAVMGWQWYANQGSPQTATIATVLHAPIQLKDEIENVPAHSYRAIEFDVPYTGSVNIGVNVVHGNPMDVFVIAPDQLPSLQALKWNDVHPYSNFTAMKTQAYDRTAQLPQGTYYLVLRDLTLGIFSKSASDVSLKMRLTQ
jgi:hypothetical protein